jgi:hypothetical protein
MFTFASFKGRRIIFEGASYGMSITLFKSLFSRQYSPWCSKRRSEPGQVSPLFFLSLIAVSGAGAGAADH